MSSGEGRWNVGLENPKGQILRFLWVLDSRYLHGVKRGNVTATLPVLQ